MKDTEQEETNMYRLIGYVDYYNAVLEESDNITTFTGFIAEIIDTYPEYTSFEVVNDLGTVVFSI